MKICKNGDFWLISSIFGSLRAQFTLKWFREGNTAKRLSCITLNGKFESFKINLGSKNAQTMRKWQIIQGFVSLKGGKT